MTTALEIITDAYRESNILGIDVVPNANQQAEGLRRLNAIISSALGFEIGENLVDWMIGNSNINSSWNPADYGPGWNENQWMRPPTNTRLLLNSSTPQIISLPNRVDNGARIAVVDILGTLSAAPVTLEGNGLTIEGAPSIVLNTDSLNRVWFFRGDLSDWVRIADVTLSGEMPFPPMFDDAFTTWLAMRINPRYGRVIDQQTQIALTEAKRKLKSYYTQKRIVPADPGVLNLTRTGYGSRFGSRARIGWMG